MRNILTRLRRAPWIVGQRLVRRPKHSNFAVSDLFSWFNDGNIKTVFELVDIYALFEGKSSSGAKMFVFNNSGQLILQKHILFEGARRVRIDFTELLSNVPDTSGTFSVFHDETPEAFCQGESFVAERGYVGYSLTDNDCFNYAHGNHDAISYDRDSENVELLGSVSILKRDYNLQYLLELGVEYVFLLTNNSKKIQNVEYRVIGNGSSSNVVLHNELQISAGGVGVFKVCLKGDSPGRLVITSKLIMARPVVFRIDKNGLDCFHG